MADCSTFLLDENASIAQCFQVKTIHRIVHLYVERQQLRGKTEDNQGRMQDFYGRVRAKSVNS